MTAGNLLLGICFWRKVREERIWAEYMGVKGGWHQIKATAGNGKSTGSEGKKVPLLEKRRKTSLHGRG